VRARVSILVQAETEERERLRVAEAARAADRLQHEKALLEVRRQTDRPRARGELLYACAPARMPADRTCSHVRTPSFARPFVRPPLPRAQSRSAPLRAYLMSEVIPTLTEGLIEVTKVRPEDPVDFLAEWIFKKNPSLD
jgi:hypothetical protein